MDDIKKQLFLAGGGDKFSSIAIDKLFFLALDKEKSLVYVPNAMRDKPYSECLKWLESVFRPLGVEKFIMQTDLGRVNLSDSLIGGVYIGGGDTVKLLHEVSKSHFDSQLKMLFEKGVPIYGGSAGAIILGQTILTAPEAKGLPEDESRGLNLINGFSIYCHYDSKKNLQSLRRSLRAKIIAIPEKSGVHLVDRALTVVGVESVSVFLENDRLCLKPGNKIDITTF